MSVISMLEMLLTVSHNILVFKLGSCDPDGQTTTRWVDNWLTAGLRG